MWPGTTINKKARLSSYFPLHCTFCDNSLDKLSHSLHIALGIEGGRKEIVFHSISHTVNRNRLNCGYLDDFEYKTLNGPAIKSFATLEIIYLFLNRC